MTARVPFEDVLAAATRIGQCASNVLTVSRDCTTSLPNELR